jgi:phycocyanin-associated, rod
MTTTPVSISEYNRRTITIEVTGMCHQNVSRTSHYTVKVPYSSLARTLQSIQRVGGTVANVTAASLSTSAPVPPTVPATSRVRIPSETVETPIAPMPVTAEAKKSVDTAGKPFKTSNTRSAKQKRR